MQEARILFSYTRKTWEKRKEELINDLKDLIILKTILEGGSYGYEIRKKIRKDFGCNLAISSIYPELKEQERNGLITCRKVEVNGRLRKVYTATPVGFSFFRYNLMKLENVIKKLKNNPLLKWYSRALNHRD